MRMKKFLLIFLLLTILFCSAYKKPYKYTIRAEKDAFYHNNVGLNYLNDRIYYAAIQEFKIAISLSPSTQASGIFYNNLGETYVYIGSPDMARDCFEKAVNCYGMNLQYYINLAKCYKSLKISGSKIAELNSSKNVYDRITLGLLYLEMGEKFKGISTLDEFCANEPDVLITPAIRKYIRDLDK